MGDGRILSSSDVVRSLPGTRVETSSESGSEPSLFDSSLSLKENLDRYEREILVRGFREAGGNVSLLSRKLKIDRANLHRKLKMYGIK
jgi:transcriptional regulator of acetoin/glycerol metabolism